jgi:formyl-CoA transferase
MGRHERSPRARARSLERVRERTGVSAPRASAALARFRVLDLTRVRAGPTAVRQLADWGADVIKIELPPGAEDGEPPGGPRSGPDFRNLHRNKRSLALDLKRPEGAAALRRLAQRADVLVENFRPGVMTRLGLDYAALRSQNPRLVYASISGFGQDGPYRERPGFDQIAQGLGGLMSVTGLPGQGPVRAGIPIADLSAGLFGALGILVALLERESSGEGQWVQTSLLAAQIFMLDFQAARWLLEGEVPGQAGNDHPTSIPTGVFRTADGHINIAAAGQKMWERLVRVLTSGEEAEALLARPEFATPAARSAHRTPLRAELEGRLARESSKTWIERLNAAGVPCGEICSIDQTFADPQVRHLGLAQSVADRGGALTLLGQPVTLSRTPSRLAAPPPGPGEHGEEVLAEFGFSVREIAALRASGALGAPGRQPEGVTQ